MCVSHVSPTMEVGSLSVQTFFGLTPEYKVELHKLLMVVSTRQFGMGMTYTELYNMPIYLRKYYIEQYLKIRKPSLV